MPRCDRRGTGRAVFSRGLCPISRPCWPHGDRADWRRVAATTAVPSRNRTTLALALAAAINAGEMLNWFWGDVTLTAPLIIPMGLDGHIMGGGLDMHGAKIWCGSTTRWPPDHLPPPNGRGRYAGPRADLANMFIVGDGVDGLQVCQNGLVIKTTNGNGNIYDSPSTASAPSAARRPGSVCMATCSRLTLCQSTPRITGLPDSSCATGGRAGRDILHQDLRRGPQDQPVRSGHDGRYRLSGTGGHSGLRHGLHRQRPAAITASAGLAMVDNCLWRTTATALPEMNCAIKVGYGNINTTIPARPRITGGKTHLLESSAPGPTFHHPLRVLRRTTSRNILPRS